MDESRFKEQVAYLGPSYVLQCPLQTLQPQSLPRSLWTWQKDCQPLQNQEGNAFLKFSSIRLEDQGNYTCTQHGNSTPSFTVRLVVKGEHIVYIYLKPDSFNGVYLPSNSCLYVKHLLWAVLTLNTDTCDVYLQSLSV